MRFYSATGIILFALTLTLAAIVWIQGLMYEWYSTMYGVWYFASSVWTTLATVYVITVILHRTTPLRDVVREKTYYMIGSLLFAFTVFYAYISFAQYFIVWNANMPE
jgi:succinate dehydrogenase hydrophobic anchor subunit